jgi:hypothetical protein
MQCRELKNMLVEYVEDSLDKSDVVDIKSHLKGCGKCRAELKEIKAVLSMAKDIKVKDPGNAFWAALPVQVNEKVKERKFRLNFIFRPLGALAAAALIFLAILPYAVKTHTPKEINEQAIINSMSENTEAYLAALSEKYENWELLAGSLTEEDKQKVIDKMVSDMVESGIEGGEL